MTNLLDIALIGGAVVVGAYVLHPGFRGFVDGLLSGYGGHGDCGPGEIYSNGQCIEPDQGPCIPYTGGSDIHCPYHHPVYHLGGQCCLS